MTDRPTGTATPRGAAFAAGLRNRIAVAALRRGGWPLSPRSMEPLRDFATHAMGVGSAHLGVRYSGETGVLRDLGAAWADRDEVTVLDVGAYNGDYARAALETFGPQARVHCFEPNPTLFPSLVERVGSAPGTTCHPFALGRETGSALLFLDHAGSTRASLVEASFEVIDRPVSERHEVSVRTLDGFAAEVGLARIDLLKLDVEGHELAVLQGATRLLAADAVEVVQFEFGEANLASRTYLRDFCELLGSRFGFFRLGPRGLVGFEYRTKHEIFHLETNYVAASGRARERLK